MTKDSEHDSPLEIKTVLHDQSDIDVRMITQVCKDRRNAVVSTMAFSEMSATVTKHINGTEREVSVGTNMKLITLQNGRSFFVLTSVVIGDLVEAMNPEQTYQGILNYQLESLIKARESEYAEVPILSMCSLDYASFDVSRFTRVDTNIIRQTIESFLPENSLIAHMVTVRGGRWAEFIRSFVEKIARNTGKPLGLIEKLQFFRARTSKNQFGIGARERQMLLDTEEDEELDYYAKIAMNLTRVNVLT